MHSEATVDASEEGEAVHPTQEEAAMPKTWRASKTDLASTSATVTKPKASDHKAQARTLTKKRDKTLSQTDNASGRSCSTNEDRSSVTRAGDPRQMAMRRLR